MEELDVFSGILSDFLENGDKFKELFDSANPQDLPLPSPWNERLDTFERIVFLKALRSDKLVPAIQQWITEMMDERFIIVPTFDLKKCYMDSTPSTPLIFILSPGSDPIADLMKLADDKEINRRVVSISLG